MSPRRDAAASPGVTANPPIPPGAVILPVIPSDGPLAPDKPPSSNPVTGATAASVRALTSQAIAFYFRAPVKAFFRTRVDYLAYARAVQEQQHAARRAAAKALWNVNSHQPFPDHFPTPLSPSSPDAGRPDPPPPRGKLGQAWHWLKRHLRRTTPGVLASAVRHSGWRVVPDQVLPPLIANVGVGAVLYTSYLQILGRLHEESSRATKRVYPPPAPLDTFAAGFLAGAIQSVAAAPLDAVQARYDLGSVGAGMTGSGNPLVGSGLGNGANGGLPNGVNGRGVPVVTPLERPQSMWAFSYAKLREIGVRGIFAGWGLSFLKDSLGCAVFFSSFEYVKAQGYYRFVTWYYSSLSDDVIVHLSRKRPAKTTDSSAVDGAGEDGEKDMPTIIRPHYAIEPAFLMLAGMAASVAQQVVIHPLSHIQVEHWERLEMLDAKARRLREKSAAAAGQPDSPPRSKWRWKMFRAYYRAYQETWATCVAEAETAGTGMWRWLYRGFWWNTIRQVPSTSAGLIIFELVRRKYGFGGEPVRINRDGYDILLN